MEDKIKFKLKEYKDRYDLAKAVVDKQERFDVSFQAEVEDEILLIAEAEYKAVEDVYNFIFAENN